MTSTSRPLRLANARGVAYGAIPVEIERDLERWIDAGEVSGAEALKPGRVWRAGGWALKRFEARRSPLGRLRRSPALRCAELCDEIEPVSTPRPLFALDVVSGPRKGEGWLAVRFVEGLDLARALREDPAAARALPAFLAGMQMHGVLHGDLNVRNVLWSGGAWTLIDLESLRASLHRLRTRSIAEDWWVRIGGTLRDPESVRPLHAHFCELVGRPLDAESRWPSIAQRARRLAAEYDRRVAERLARGE